VISLKHALFWALFGFTPKCGCGAKATGKQTITAGVTGVENKVGVMLTCDEHMAECDAVRYVDRMPEWDD